MKTIPPTCPEPESGRKYWRSLDELAETPEFRQWVEREFPPEASEWADTVSRRHFVKIMSASFLLGGLGLAGSGCRRPEEKILPFGKMPEDYVHGVPQYYATAMPTRGSAIPLVVKATDGRPIKIEGNDRHPDSNGGTDRYAQASILNLYDPDRATRFVSGGNVTSAEKAEDGLNRLYMVESLFTLTGFNADHRLRIPSGHVPNASAALAYDTLKEGNGLQGLEKLAKAGGIDPKWIEECAKDLMANRG